MVKAAKSGAATVAGVTQMDKRAVSSASAQGDRAVFACHPRRQLLFVSGQVPIDPATGNMIDGDIEAQTRRVLDNIGALLEAGGVSFANVVRTTVFLADMNDFAAMNEVYGTYFRRAVSGARDRPGRAAAKGRARRDRRDRDV